MESSLTKNISEIKLFKDYHILDSYIGKQLYYLYHSCSSSSENLKLLKDSIESFSSKDNENELILTFSILNSFQSFLVNKLQIDQELRDNNDNE
ncbi:hypothetical protein DICPUDRAFT_153410, partial [Dictyostelium purpureum]